MQKGGLMKGLDTGKDKVKKICDVLRRETLEPARREAEEVVEQAKAEAEKILAAAHAEADRLHHVARAEIEKQKAIFQSSLAQSSRQTLELLKQEVEERLFSRELSRLLSKETQNPKIIADLINAVIKAIEKEGIDTDLSIYIPAAVEARAVNSLLAQEIVSKLREKSVLLSDIGGGISVKMHNENMTIDITEATLRDVVSQFLRKDFRELLFSAK